MILKRCGSTHTRLMTVAPWVLETGMCDAIYFKETDVLTCMC